MITPIRGRKPCRRISLPTFSGIRLEMITPIRGRKLSSMVSFIISGVIRNDNPDKGTETVVFQSFPCRLKAIRNDNPDKGTET